MDFAPAIGTDQLELALNNEYSSHWFDVDVILRTIDFPGGEAWGYRTLDSQGHHSLLDSGPWEVLGPSCLGRTHQLWAIR